MKKISQKAFDDLVNQKVEEILYSDEFEKGFDDWLNEMQEPCKVGNLEYLPSEVLKNCDPIAYRVCFSDDYMGSERERIEEDVISELETEYEIIEETLIN